MDLNENNQQNRKDFNDIKKLSLYLKQKNLTLRSAQIYAHLSPEGRSTCLRTVAVSTVIKLLQAGLKS